MNIYLDIDGVLIHDSLAKNGTPANYAVEFLRAITSKHNCFWLTTHCRGGENNAPEFLANKLPLIAKEYLKKIQPTDWNSWKTEAIDFSQDFRWIDDETYDPELKDLRKHDCEEKLIFVNLQKDPNQLREIISTLEIS